ncbi:MAG: ABC transporter ATP-binding protein/permease [Synergistaceae bacterium]|jgi:ATP-binding cassette subfamily B protein|nr:ABC transporter ATP-binding protein/permease [Synergistaceae bacterium]
MLLDKRKRPRLALLWNVSDGSRALYSAAVLFMLISVFCGFLLPQVVRFVVDNVVRGLPVYDIPVIPNILVLLGVERTTESLRKNIEAAGVVVLAIAAFGGICGYLYQRMLAQGAEGLILRLRSRLFSHIQSLPYEWHIAIQTGDIVQRCTSDVEIIRNFLFTQLIEIVRAVAFVFFAYVMLFRVDVPLSLASFVFLLVIFLYSFLFLRANADRFLPVDEAEGQLLAVAQENFTGVRVVRAFGREAYEVGRFGRQNEIYADLWVKLGNMLSTFWGVGDFLTGMQMITICAFGAIRASSGNITVGEFMVFLTYNSMIIWPVRGLGRVLSEASKARASLGRLVEILGSPAESDPPGAIETPISGGIEFDGVSFSYGDTPVLRDISFSIRQGTTLGILGTTGSGKTTVAHLLCGLYNLEEGCGEIRIDGININRYKRRWLRQNIGIVLQEPFLYSRTIGENIASLTPGRSPDELREAAAVARVDDAIMKFPQGYNTLVGERGVTLSGGQKQRVAIARAVLNSPPIMIFDDSLSAVDAETDAKIRAALARRAGSATTIIISHRMTSLSGADTVIVMEDGRIAEMGGPAELLARDGIYRRISDMQRIVESEISEAED